jgi:hypothetical protein
LKVESRRLEKELSGRPEMAPTESSAYREWDIRAYRLEDATWSARTVAELEKSFAPDRVYVERVRRGAEIFDASPEIMLQRGDTVAVAARRRVHAGGTPIGVEAEDFDLLDFPIAALDVVLTNKDLAGLTIAEVADLHGRGVMLLKLIRGDEEIPYAPSTVLYRGDLLQLVGARRHVEHAGAALGYVERSTHETDVVFVGLGVVIGGLVGLLSVTVGDLPLSLTASGGALIMGLVFGWLRSVRPTFGRIPEPALWVFDTIGLTVFIAVVGLTAGPSFVSGLRKTGPSLPAGGSRRRGRSSHGGVVLRSARAENESVDSPRRMRRGRNRDRSAAVDSGRGAEQAARARLHRALCDRQHSPDRRGVRHRAHDQVGADRTPAMIRGCVVARISKRARRSSRNRAEKSAHSRGTARGVGRVRGPVRMTGCRGVPPGRIDGVGLVHASRTEALEG